MEPIRRTLGPDALPTRGVDRAGMVMRFEAGGSRNAGVYVPAWMAAWDADATEFVRLPDLPAEVRHCVLLGLTADGTSLNLLVDIGTRERSDYQLAARKLAGGPLDLVPLNLARVSASSHDGRMLAVLSTEGAFDWDEPNALANAVVTLIDLETRGQQRVWSAPGGWSAESAIAWSPDDRLIAVTYLHRDEECDDRAATVVVDKAGTVQVGPYLDCQLLQASGGTWTDDGRIIVDESSEDTDWETTVTFLDPTGSREPVRISLHESLGLTRAPYAVHEDVLICYGRTIHTPPEDPTSLVAVSWRDMEPRGFAVLPPYGGISALDIAPSVLSLAPPFPQ